MATQSKTRRDHSTLARLAQWIPDEAAARQWFEAVHFPGGDLRCLRCGSGNVYRCKHKTMPFRCRSCRKYFSVKTGTAIEASNLPLKTWVWAIYLEVTRPDGISSMALHRALGVRQATAWFILHRIREGLAPIVDRVRGSTELPGEAIIGARSDRESDWTQFKPAYNGTFRRMSEKHLGRYMGQYAGKVAMRDMSTQDQVVCVAQQMVGRRVRFRDLIA